MQCLLGQRAVGVPALSGSRSVGGARLRPCATSPEGPRRAPLVAPVPSILGNGTKRQASVVPTAISASHSPSAEKFNLFDIDGYIEESRPELRTVYDHERWVLHRSPSRYLRHMLNLSHSRVLRAITPPLLYALSVATAVCAYQAALKARMLPAYLPNLAVTAGAQVFGLTSFALSLLLVFRTNTSYERWDGARKTWGLVLNRSRDLVRQGLAWIPRERAELRAMLCRWVPAFSRALLVHLRRNEDITKQLEGVLLPHEIESVVKAAHRPNYVLQVLAEIIRSAGLPTAPTLAMDTNLSHFEDCLGGCERVLRTPIPLSYTTHTSRFMIIWLTLLPFTLVSTMGWVTVPMCGLVSFLLLGIKEITVAIEEPFSVLALEAIAGTMLTNTRELEGLYNNSADSETIPLSASSMVAISELEDRKASATPIGAPTPNGEVAANGTNGGGAVFDPLGNRPGRIR